MDTSKGFEMKSTNRSYTSCKDHGDCTSQVGNNMIDDGTARIKRLHRKLMKPQRSAAHLDPQFRGAHIWLNTEVRGERSELQISACFRKVKNLHERVTRRRHNSGGITDSHSGSDEESIVSYAKQSYLAVKTCASCGTHRTPLWRDAEDGTPLCNACGIRYKKYRVRCGHCWSIPKKDVKTYPNCPMCGSLLRLSFSRRTW